MDHQIIHTIVEQKDSELFPPVEGAPGSDAAVAAHEAAENPHPQYFRRDQPIESSISTPQGTSTHSLSGTGVLGQFASLYYPTDDPEVEESEGAAWAVTPEGFSTRYSYTTRNPADQHLGYKDQWDETLSLTRDGISSKTTKTVINEEEYSREVLSGISLKFPEEITNLTLPVTGNVETPETIATREWVSINVQPAEGTVLAEHINSPTPHPAYDDGPSLLLIYNNAKV